MRGKNGIIGRRWDEASTYLLALNARSGAFSRKAIHCPDTRNRKVRKAWAMFSGRTNCRVTGQRSNTNCHGATTTYLVKLVTKVYWVNVIAFQIREHYNLWRMSAHMEKGEIDDVRRKPCRRGVRQPWGLQTGITILWSQSSRRTEFNPENVSRKSRGRLRETEQETPRKIWDT